MSDEMNINTFLDLWSDFFGSPEDYESASVSAPDTEPEKAQYKYTDDPDAAALDGITYAFRLAGLIDKDDYASAIRVVLVKDGDWVDTVYLDTEQGKHIELPGSIRVTNGSGDPYSAASLDARVFVGDKPGRITNDGSEYAGIFDVPVVGVTFDDEPSDTDPWILPRKVVWFVD